MAEYRVTGTQLTAIANAIRAKAGGSEPLEFPDDFISKVNGITAKRVQSYNDIPVPVKTYITVQPGKMVQLSDTAYVQTYNSPIISYSFSLNFSGRDNLEIYTKFVQNRVRYFAYNTGSSNVEIPSGVVITCRHYLNSASL